jgi:hypothetical protein
MLTEYALIPDILDASCYSTQGICSVHLQGLKEVVLREALVADLHNGNLGKYISANANRWDPKGKELFKKIVTQNRLISRPAIGLTTPNVDTEWIDEAYAAHNNEPLDGIITSEVNKLHRQDPIIASIEKLSSAVWWQNRTSSIRVLRNTQSYIKALEKILRYSNSIMFIDPHLHPYKHSYREFELLLAAIRNTTPKPLISIHRVCYDGTPQNKISNQDWESLFKKKFSTGLLHSGVTVEIYIWDVFHYRYVISDLIGLFIDNGLDLDQQPGRILQIARLGKIDSDDIQREFDPASGRHQLIHKFSIP